MIFYTSDLHFFHSNIIKLCNRPFNTVDEMNKVLIEKWNKRVKPTDTVYILGDIVFKFDNIEQVKKILKSLNGYKFLIRGNHDDFLHYLNQKEFFEGVFDYKEVHDNKRKIILFHYPIEEWNGFYKGSYHLYGHVHNSESGLKKIDRRYNVGVDVCDFEPKTLDELIEKFKQ